MIVNPEQVNFQGNAISHERSNNTGNIVRAEQSFCWLNCQRAIWLAFQNENQLSELSFLHDAMYCEGGVNHGSGDGVWHAWLTIDGQVIDPAVCYLENIDWEKTEYYPLCQISASDVKSELERLVKGAEKINMSNLEVSVPDILEKNSYGEVISNWLYTEFDQTEHIDYSEFLQKVLLLAGIP